jgi:hypothetical protein
VGSTLRTSLKPASSIPGITAHSDELTKIAQSVETTHQLQDEAAGDSLEQVTALDRFPEQVKRDLRAQRPGQVRQKLVLEHLGCVELELRAHHHLLLQPRRQPVDARERRDSARHVPLRTRTNGHS